MSEQEQIQRAAKGDWDAFDALVIAYQGRLRAFAAGYVQDSDDVFDLVQDAFLDALKGLKRFDTAKSFWPWLRAICMNRIRNFYRSRKKNRETVLNVVDLALEECVWPDPESETEHELDWMSALDACLTELREPHREIIDARFTQGHSMKEIANQIGASISNITTSLSRAKSVLAKCVETRLGKETP